MLKCKQATHLMSEAQDRPLEIGERLRLGLHLGICGSCRNFRRQMDFLRQACSALRRRYAEPSDSENKPR